MTQDFNSTRELATDKTLTSVLNFVMQKKIMNINTIILAEVLSVDVSSKRLTIKSLVNGVDSKKTPIIPPSIYNVPYCSIRGGNAGIITEYVIGDTVVVGFCQRQIDAVKKTGQRQTPNLTRFHSLNDAIVLAHWSNTAPSIYIKITDDEIEINGNTKPISVVTQDDVMVVAKNITAQASQNLTIDGADDINITATNIRISGNLFINSQLFLSHTHSGVTTGSGVSGPVIPSPIKVFTEEDV